MPNKEPLPEPLPEPLQIFIKNSPEASAKLLEEDKGALKKEEAQLAKEQAQLAKKKAQLEVIEQAIKEAQKTRSAQAALFQAARKGCISGQLLSLLKNADVNTANKDGMTPLMCAAHFNNKVVLKQLLAQDHINIFQKNRDHKTALDLAVKQGHLEIVRTIVQHEKYDFKKHDLHKTLRVAIFSQAPRSSKVFTELLQHCKTQKCLSSILNQQTESAQQTLLMDAVKHSREQIVKELLDQQDLKLDLRNDSGETAFILAPKFKNTNIFSMLLEKTKRQADYSDEVQMAFKIAIGEGSIEIVNLLLQGESLEIVFPREKNYGPISAAYYDITSKYNPNNKEKIQQLIFQAAYDKKKEEDKVNDEEQAREEQLQLERADTIPLSCFLSEGKENIRPAQDAFQSGKQSPTQKKPSPSPTKAGSGRKRKHSPLVFTQEDTHVKRTLMLPFR